MNASADVIVLGLGVHGIATVASLARRGIRVIGLEQFSGSHDRGSSHGRTRMIRRAYPNAVWNGLIDHAYDAWERLERDSGKTLIVRTGGLYAHRGQAQMQGQGCIVLEDPEQIAACMPGLHVPEGYHAVYDPHAGMIEAAAALDALTDSAVRAGADLRYNVRVAGWETTSGGVVLSTTDGMIRGARLVIAAGSWADRVVPVLGGLLEVWRILTLTAAAGQAAGQPPTLGAFSIDRDEGLLFGIPDAAGNGVKIGVDAGQVWDPDVPVAPPSAVETAELRALLHTYVPALNAEAIELTACLYTMTEDRRFILGPLANAPEVVIISACSGHGFKFGAAIGDAAADLALGIERPDLDFISTARRGL